MATPSPYRSLPAEKRVALLTAAMTASREMRAVFAQRLVARGGGFRAATVLGWAPEKLAREIVRLNAQTANDELDLLQFLYVDLEPQIQITFLDAAGVAHDGGKIPDELEPPYASEDAVRRGADAVREQHGADGLRYLRTLVRYNLSAWPALDQVVAEYESAD
jgi:hypothetical protein